jgi:ABC-type Zn uptake system ZnuABC Zn-binding protein ZnuA
VDPRLERQIAREAGARVISGLYTDSLGPPGSPGATYLGMMEANVRLLVAGFLGRPPG